MERSRAAEAAGRVRRAGSVGLVALVGAAASATALGFLGEWSWLLGLLGHFRPQYAAGCLALAALAVALRHRPAALSALGLGAVNAALLAPAWLPARAAAPPERPSLEVLLLNVSVGNRQFAAVSALIEREAPDLVGLLEVNATWAAALEPALAPYPARRVVARDDAFGIALYSRRPLLSIRQRHLTPGATPSLVAQLELGGAPLGVVLTHPPPPVTAWTSRQRDAHLARLAGAVREIRGEVVVLGDLNTTPWSSPFRRLLAAAGLRDSREGFGLQATWPARIPVARIPLDHVLLSPGLAVADRRVLGYVGSDHLPVAVRIAPAA